MTIKKKKNVASKKIEAKAAPVAAPAATNRVAVAATPPATTGKPEASSVSFKNFRHHPDMENFYRFIYDNDLRFEALELIDQVLVDNRNKKKISATKSRAH
jgi:hypothetical protein